MKQQSNGFTLIELMISVVILSVLVTLAVPSFRIMIDNNRATSQANEFLQLITLARSEAVRRNRTIVMCAAADIVASEEVEEALSAACFDNPDWGSGVIIFVDNDLDGEISEGEEIIRQQIPLAPGLQLRKNGAASAHLSFGPNGLGNLGATGATWDVIPKGSTEVKKRVVISTTGRTKVTS